MFFVVDKDTLTIRAILRNKPQISNNLVVIDLDTVDTDPDHFKVLKKGDNITVQELTTTEKSQVDNLKLLQAKQNLLRHLSNITRKYIEKYYPEVKQRSDIADKEYCGSVLLTLNSVYTTDQIYKDCANYASQILAGTGDLQTIVSSLPTVEQPYWEQLIKVAVRVGWVNQVKQIYRQLKSQIEQAIDYSQFPQLPTDIDMVDLQPIDNIFPKYPKGV